MSTKTHSSPFIFASCLALLGVLLSGCQSLPENPPPTVDSVVLERYTGLWYEIARLPVFFQKENERATADYSLKVDGTVHLVNTAIAPDGSTRSVTGTAVPVPGSKHAKLKVSIDNFFAKLFGSPPEYGNYWILKLEPDYSLALVGSPDRDTLWLLSRTKVISPELFQSYIDYAGEIGYETEPLIVHP